MSYKTSISTLMLMVLLAGSATALTVTLGAQFGGHDERIDGAGACGSESAFLMGVAGTDANLRVGGNSYGCDSEWAAGFEFDVGGIPTGQEVNSALLIVRKTGWADDAPGFAIVGAYSYSASGMPVQVERADLTPETALDILTPPVANVDLQFDVTSVIQDLVDNGDSTAGLMLCGIYSEAGYLSYITIGNVGGSYPPRLVVDYDEGTVAADRPGWGAVKSLFK